MSNPLSVREKTGCPLSGTRMRTPLRTPAQSPANFYRRGDLRARARIEDV